MRGDRSFKSQQLGRSIVECVHVPLLVLDATSRIRSVNRAFSEVFHMEARDVEGQVIYALGGGCWNFPGLRDRLERVLNEQQSFEKFEVRGEFPSIGQRVLMLNGCRLRDLDYTLLAVEDVTSARETEEVLRVTEVHKMEAIGRLAGGVAHDLGNLLSAIAAHGGLISASLEEGHEALESVREIDRAVRRASTLMDQLLALSSRKILLPRVFDLIPFLDDLKGTLRHLIDEHIQIVVRLADGLWRAIADPAAFEQAMMSLCLNARDAMPLGGTLTISVVNAPLGEQEAKPYNLRAGQYVRLEIGDSGIGMDPQTLRHIFEPFFTTKRIGNGAGLGLATVRNIVEQSDGAIQCHSQPGQGTTFTILLPATT
jgi:signal transduction histidine kinase